MGQRAESGGKRAGRTAITTMKEHLHRSIGFGGPTPTKVGTETQTRCPAYIKRGRETGGNVRGIGSGEFR
jgi:hypothetical protein